ncbi:DUF3883 domain-containing protein [Ruegeria sp. HKCCC1038]|uniref:DUF3883 domain-containing protein n=1 Tax=Ruegeria sp. HKCCC1038 TaxID=2682982 RepID=UPI0014895927|nr:DUF3883 domain-containing protein [Ruegeria sp. HKCCC1038]
MTPPSLDRCFSMAAFLAFVELRQFLSRHPSLPFSEALDSVKRLKTGASGLDFHAAVTLSSELDQDLPWDSTKKGLRLFVYEWVRLVQPNWLRRVPNGREYVRTALTTDEAQCFREAGLFEHSPDDDAIAWWDKIAALIRGAVDAEKMERARLAERLSLQHEKQRLASLGIEREPKWMSLEDNNLGYDILSFDVSDGLVVSRLIEVKSTLSDTIILTRGEWNNAVSAPTRTVFHVWRLPVQSLIEIPVAAMASHIPQDSGNGVWRDVAVTLSAADC